MFSDLITPLSYVTIIEYDNNKMDMFELVRAFITALISLSNDMAVYILFGLFFAGILHELVPSSFV